MKYPTPLQKGSRIGITAFSSGVPENMHQRLDKVLDDLAIRGFEILEGQCLRQNHQYQSASSEDRAYELMSMLLNDQIDAVMAPWGGAVCMDLLTKLDWQQLASAKPKWVIGFSDISTLLSAITMKLGWATAHTSNLMQLNIEQQDHLTNGVFKHLSQDKAFEQKSSALYEHGILNFVTHPAGTFDLTRQTKLKLLNPEKLKSDVGFSGRLLGGCLDIHMLLLGSEFFDIVKFQAHYKDGVILYFENGEMNAPQLFRALQSIKLKVNFDQINGILLGRNPSMAHHQDYDFDEAIKHAWGDLPVPVVYDVDIGHVAPNLLCINGAFAEVQYEANKMRIKQSLI